MSEPITINEAKAQARIDLGDDDALLDSYIERARAFVEDHTGLILKRRTVVLGTYQLQNGARYVMNRVPVNAITDAYFFDRTGLKTATSTAQFVLQPKGSSFICVLSDSALAGQLVFVEADAGYRTREDIPASLRAAVATMVAHYYEHRGDSDIGNLPPMMKHLLQQHRLWRFE